MQDLIGQSGTTPPQPLEFRWNVPPPLTSLIGREQESTQISALLSNPEVRLLTLLGPGGIGKTRLSIEVATRIRPLFADGVCFISLASINDPARLIFALAQALDIKEKEAQPLDELLVAYLQTKKLLLLLDNFEQLHIAALTLSDLLANCTGIKILVTSRAALRIQGEQEFLIQPLALPPLDQLPDPEAIKRYAAVALFYQRVQALVPSFQITQTNARTIAEICTHLDGLPLALELAAARIKLLSPQALLIRLSRRLQVLTGGARTLPVRQQTLYNTLKWSYDLLEPQEQVLFQRISIFANGSSLQAIEAIYATLNKSTDPVLDSVSSLIDKCLLQKIEQDDPEPRLEMLETIREYGRECLSSSGETEVVRYAHATYYLTLAEEAEPGLDGVTQAIEMEHLERERDNLREAFLWLVSQADNKQVENREHLREMALRLAGSLRLFWLVRGCVGDEHQSLKQALAAQEQISPHVRARALLTLGTLLSLQGQHDEAEEVCKESLSLFRRLREPRSMATVLYQLGRIAWIHRDLTQARTLAEEALIYAKESGHKGSIAWALFRLIRLLVEQHEYVRSQALLEENLAMHKETGNKRGMASSLYNLAQIHLVTQSSPEIVLPLIRDTLALFKEVGDKEGIAYTLYLSGWQALNQGQTTVAHQQLQESIALFKSISHQEGCAWVLTLLGRVATAQGNYAAAFTFYQGCMDAVSKLDHNGLLATCLEGMAATIAEQQSARDSGASGDSEEEMQPNAWWAARLWGSAEALRSSTGIPIFPCDREAQKRPIAIIRKHLGDGFFDIAWSEGKSLTPNQALQAQKRGSISGQLPRTDAEPTSPTELPDGLTVREVEVLCLVAQSLTSAQIAEHLTLSLLTVNSHVRSIYSKLGITSRSAATRYAIEHKLCQDM